MLDKISPCILFPKFKVFQSSRFHQKSQYDSLINHEEPVTDPKDRILFLAYIM